MHEAETREAILSVAHELRDAVLEGDSEGVDRAVQALQHLHRVQTAQQLGYQPRRSTDHSSITASSSDGPDATKSRS